MKKQLSILIVGIIILVMAGCKKEKTPTSETPQTKIAFKLKLKNTNGNITYNQSITNINQLEYKWAIFVDSDSDSTTGDIFGYDVEISMTYFKQSNTSFSGGLLNKTQYNTWILDKNSGKYGHSLSASIDATNNTLILTGIKEAAELSRINSGDRIKIETTCMDGSDRSAVGIFPQKIDDPVDDAAPDYIDIISLEIVE